MDTHAGPGSTATAFDTPTHEDVLSYLHESLAAVLDPRELRRRGSAILAEISRDAAPLLERLGPTEISIRITRGDGEGRGRSTIQLLLADHPFLFDTFRLTLKRLGLHEQLALHTVLRVEREADGSIVALGKSVRGREAYLFAEVSRIESSEQMEQITRELRTTIEQVHDVVADHCSMIECLRDHISALKPNLPSDPAECPTRRELAEFLDWLANDNFVFLGYRSYEVSRIDDHWTVRLEQDSGLGTLREDTRSRFVQASSGMQIPAIIRARMAEPGSIFFDKSTVESTIHRHGRLDSISVKRFDSMGRLRGFGKFTGLLTHKAIRTSGSSIPILSRRRDQVLERIEAEPGSHTYKSAIEAYDSLPIEFLFPFDSETVFCAVQRIVYAREHPSIATCVFPDPLNRSFFASAILPLSLYDEDLRCDLRELLVNKYDVTYVDTHCSFLDDEIALIHFFCTTHGEVDLRALEDLEHDISECAIRWDDRFESALTEHYPPAEAERLARMYRPLLPKEYRVVTFAEEAASDVEKLERLRQREVPIELGFTTEFTNEGARRVRIKVYQKKCPYLTDLLPLLDYFGLRVIDATRTEICDPSSESLWIVTFRLEGLPQGFSPAAKIGEKLFGGLRAALEGWIEGDSLNRLILGAGLSWREVELIRSYRACATQLGSAADPGFISTTLLAYPLATRALLGVFRARLDPSRNEERTEAEHDAREELTRRREAIPTANEDRVFALFADLIQCTMRTDFFAVATDRPEPIAFKLDSKRVKSMPSPRPFAEIFVHSSEMMGVHLRGGPIARGGIRWSDRVQDFRREILGLMKTQMTKNGLIIPVGAKGGFILKNRSSDPSVAREQADRQYERFIRSLLRITDNVVGEEIVSPDRVVCHDEGDPYLVVAADKGTAHLSDVANRVAIEADFWLGDAFASGGSDGYDHKREGITARGAWICTKRHFRELGVDLDRQEFTICGIGDMSGDVFGNGLRLARRGKLLAAFNHLHVFLDPNPDPEIAWAERCRLFELPRSSWIDYDPEKLSAGGGVFERSARAIPLSPQVQTILDVQDAVLSGEDLIRTILCMPVDLLWNGGVGTYVKASQESSNAVGDRATDSVRVDANRIRARVIAEGGNLGLTQRARVEYALAGGRINTDALDNSAGVDLSDHEVNLKILFAPLRVSGTLSLEQRNEQLRACLDEATESVLAHNAEQSRCLSMDLVRSQRDPEQTLLAYERLVRDTDLDPALEYLPTRKELYARANEMEAVPCGHTRPELAVMLGYTKMLAKRTLVSSELLDHPGLEPLLSGYFPRVVRQSFRDAIRNHRLRRDIKATCLTNHVIDQAGITLLPELLRWPGKNAAEGLVAYFMIDRLLDAATLRQAVEQQPGMEEARIEAGLRIEQAVRCGTRTFLTLEQRAWLEPDEWVRWRGCVDELREIFPQQDRVESGSECGSGEDPLTRKLVRLNRIASNLGVVACAIRSDTPLAEVLDLYGQVGARIGVDWLLEHLRGVSYADRWERMACDSLYLEALAVRHALSGRLLDAGDRATGFREWSAGQAPALDQIACTIQQIEADDRLGLGALMVLSQQLRRLC